MQHKVLASLGLAAVGAAAHASAVIYTMDIAFYGYVGATYVAGDTLTLTATGDTSNVVDIGFGTDHHDNLTVAFSVGAMSGTITENSRFFINHGLSVAGFSRASTGGNDYADALGAGLTTYDYSVDYDSNVSYWYLGNVETSLGTLSHLDSAPVHLNIDVDAVPEPGTMAALGLGIAAMARRRRRA